MTRRDWLFAMAAAPGAASVRRTGMGLATTSFLGSRRPKDTYDYLELCDKLGAGGIQSALSSLEPADLRRLRDRAERAGMYIEVMSGLPRTDVAQFERTVAAAKEVGALAIRTACLGGRRYETFSTLADWKKFVADSKAAIARAVPIVEKHRVPLAIENHKDWTLDEIIPLLRAYSSESVAACLDTGNNISMLDDPMELVEGMAPYAVSVHLKDMGVQRYEDGFLLSEVPLGEGYLDMPRIVATIQKARPKTRFSLEMMTRDPLKVPCLTDKYWATFPSRNGRFLARTLAAVERNSAPSLQRVSHLSQVEQWKADEENIDKCIRYAQERLRL
jgi:3-oxoisoapionate decarboxylase